MTRLTCLSLCACLALSLTAMACGSSNSSGPPTWDQARIGDTGTNWYFSAVKGADYVFVNVGNGNSASDSTMKADVIAFAQPVLAKYQSGAAPVSMVPGSGAVAGWTFNPAVAKSYPNPGVATDETSAVSLIDGGAAEFFTSSYQASGFAWENYINGTYTLELQVWQMANSQDAKQLYADLPTTSPLYSNVPNWILCTGTGSNPCP